MEKSSIIVNENLLSEVLQLNISEIFKLQGNGNNFLSLDESGRKQLCLDRVKELLPMECINLGNVANDKNSKKANVIEELIAILNTVFKHSEVIFQKKVIGCRENLGEQGQKELLLTKYLANVESRILRDFLKLKRKFKPNRFLMLINRIVEYENLISRNLNKNPTDLTKEELLNKKLMESMVTSEFFAIQFSQLYNYLDETSKVTFSHQTKVTQELNHPIVNLYVKDLIRRNRSKARIEKMSRQLKNFFAWLPILSEFKDYSINDIPVWEITREHLLEYKNYLIRQSKLGTFTKYTCKLHFKDIKTFFKRIYELNIKSEDIGMNINNIKASDYFYRKLPNNKDMENLFGAIQIYSENPEKDTLAFSLISFLGFRIIELHRINWEDINLGTKTIVVHSKGNKEHILPIPDVIYKMLCMIPKGDRVGFLFRKSNQEKEKCFNSRIETAFTLYKVLADWDIDGGPHLLRHWFITNLARQNLEPVDIKTLARHDSLKTTAKYIHYYASELKEAINKIDYEVNL